MPFAGKFAERKLLMPFLRREAWGLGQGIFKAFGPSWLDSAAGCRYILGVARYQWTKCQ